MAEGLRSESGALASIQWSTAAQGRTERLCKCVRALSAWLRGTQLHTCSLQTFEAFRCARTGLC